MMFQLYFGNKESNRAAVKELIKLTPPSYIPVMLYADNFTTFHLISTQARSFQLSFDNHTVIAQA
jgi:hypothetical protein